MFENISDEEFRKEVEKEIKQLRGDVVRANNKNTKSYIDKKLESLEGRYENQNIRLNRRMDDLYGRIDNMENKKSIFKRIWDNIKPAYFVN